MDKYISREKAIKELREVYENEYPTVSGDFDEYASHDVPNVLKNMPSTDVQPVNQWISVKDSVPEAGVNVLVTDGMHMMVTWCEYVDNQCLWVDNYYEYVNVRFKEVTHWMPLPEFPKN